MRLAGARSVVEDLSLRMEQEFRGGGIALELTREDIVCGLKALGVKDGDVLMVHSALSSLGSVSGGPDAVIDAIVEAVGPTGTVAMPTLYIPSISSGEVFDVDDSPSQMGTITEVFRKRQGTVRSIHPTHPVAAAGARAEELVADHALAPTACGEGTPFSKLVDWGGKVLLLGVDQDRNTLLHTAEDYADCPYLTPRFARYRDPADGQVKELTLQRFPGPHRDFIGLDSLFREAGTMETGKIGNAVCRLMDAAGTVRVAVDALWKDPAAVLCSNPACADCIRQRGFIRRKELAGEDFTLSVRIDEPADFEALSRELWGYGITSIEIGPVLLQHLLEEGIDASAKAIADSGLNVTGVDITDAESIPDAAELATGVGASRMILDAPECGLTEARTWIGHVTGLMAHDGPRLLIRNDSRSSVNTAEATDLLTELGIGLAFDPSQFAAVGQNPFLRVYYHGISKSLVGQLYVKDGGSDGEPTEPGFGNGEVKELISILRCRSFSGPMVIWPRESIASSCQAFWDLLKSM